MFKYSQLFVPPSPVNVDSPPTSIPPIPQGLGPGVQVHLYWSKVGWDWGQHQSSKLHFQVEGLGVWGGGVGGD